MRAVLQRVASASVTGAFDPAPPRVIADKHTPCSGRGSGFRDLQRFDGLGGYRNRSASHVSLVPQRLMRVDSADDTVADIEVLTSKMYTKTSSKSTALCS